MPKEALRQINLAIDLGLDVDPVLHYHKGNILQNLGKSAESAKSLEESKKLLASHPKVRILCEFF